MNNTSNYGKYRITNKIINDDGNQKQNKETLGQASTNKNEKRSIAIIVINPSNTK